MRYRPPRSAITGRNAWSGRVGGDGPVGHPARAADTNEPVDIVGAA